MFETDLVAKVVTINKRKLTITMSNRGWEGGWGERSSPQPDERACSQATIGSRRMRPGKNPSKVQQKSLHFLFWRQCGSIVTREALADRV